MVQMDEELIRKAEKLFGQPIPTEEEFERRQDAVRPLGGAFARGKINRGTPTNNPDLSRLDLQAGAGVELRRDEMEEVG